MKKTGCCSGIKMPSGFAEVFSRKTIIPASVGFLTSYNSMVLSVVMYVLNCDPYYENELKDIGGLESSIQVSTLFGAVIGSLVVGFLGDIWGRKKALLFALSVQISGAFMGTCFTWGTALCRLLILLVSRLITGVGLGGCGALIFVATADSYESKEEEEKEINHVIDDCLREDQDCQNPENSPDNNPENDGKNPNPNMIINSENTQNMESNKNEDDSEKNDKNNEKKNNKIMNVHNNDEQNLKHNSLDSYEKSDIEIIDSKNCLILTKGFNHIKNFKSKVYKSNRNEQLYRCTIAALMTFPGTAFPSLLLWAMWSMTRSLEATWRACLGFGVLGGIVCVILVWKLFMSNINSNINTSIGSNNIQNNVNDKNGINKNNKNTNKNGNKKNTNEKNETILSDLSMINLHEKITTESQRDSRTAIPSVDGSYNNNTVYEYDINGTNANRACDDFFDDSNNDYNEDFNNIPHVNRYHVELENYNRKNSRIDDHVNSMNIYVNIEPQKKNVITLRDALSDRRYWKHLSATFMMNFLNSFTYFGFAIIQPSFIGERVASDEKTKTIDEVALYNFVVFLLCLPAPCLSILLLHIVSCKWILVMTGLIKIFTLILLNVIPTTTNMVVTTLLTVSLFVHIVGIGTFASLIPAVAFPTQCRATFTGLSTMGRWFGGAVGIYSFTELFRLQGGDACVWMTLAVFIVLTFICLIYKFPKQHELINNNPSENEEKNSQKDQNYENYQNYEYEKNHQNNHVAPTVIPNSNESEISSIDHDLHLDKPVKVTIT